MIAPVVEVDTVTLPPAPPTFEVFELAIYGLPPETVIAPTDEYVIVVVPPLPPEPDPPILLPPIAFMAVVVEFEMEII